jgi:hypothetical protein
VILPSPLAEKGVPAPNPMAEEYEENSLAEDKERGTINSLVGIASA